MNNLTEQIKSKYTPRLSVVVYELDRRYYLELHEIVNGKLGPGKPLEQEQIQDIVEYFDTDQRTDSNILGIIPPGVLYSDWSMKNKVLVWRNEPQSRMMYFTKDLHIKNGVANQPALVYHLDNGSLNIYAVDDAGKLYDAPYHNVSGADVCLGSAKLPRPKTATYESIIQHYEQLFWKSEFSHLAGNESPVNGNLNSYWKSNIGKKTKFDYSILKESTEYKTVNDLLTNL